MCVSCSKCILVLFNVLTGLAGAAILVVGLILKLGEDKIDWIKQSVVPLLQRVVLGGNSNLSFADLFDALTLALIVVGSVLLGLSLMGIIGACCSSECILFMYAALVGCVVLAEAGLIAAFFIYKGQLTIILDDSLQQTIATSYVGTGDALSGGNQITAAWDAVQAQLQCCGAVGPNDYNNASQWPAQSRQKQIVPSSCCRPSSSCTMSPTRNNSYTEGCVAALMAYLQNHDVIIGVCVAIVFAVEVILVAMSCIISCNERKMK